MPESFGDVRQQGVDDRGNGFTDSLKDLEDVTVFSRNCFAERYAESRLEIHIHIFMSDSNDFCATLQRSRVDGNRDSCFWRDTEPLNIDVGDIDENEWEVPMLVDVREFLEQPERLVPSIARLHFGNYGLGLCADSSQLPFTLLFKLNLVNENGELNRPGRDFFICQDQRPDQVVEGRPVIIDSIPQDSVDTSRDGRRVGLKPPDMLKGIRVKIVGDTVGVTFDGLCDGLIQRVTMLVRTCNFRLDAVGSRRIGIAHGRNRGAGVNRRFAGSASSAKPAKA